MSYVSVSAAVAARRRNPVVVRGLWPCDLVDPTWIEEVQSGLLDTGLTRHQRCQV